jgi:serine/threonine protein phosphatase PrpC
MGRLAVSRAIGDFEFKVPNQDGESMVSAIPEVRSYPLSNGRYIVIACDGLFDVMSSVEVVEFVNRRIAMYVARSEEPDPESICIDLITESVMKRGTSDNVTIVLIFLKKFT